MIDWDSYRKDFPVLQHQVFLDTAYHCPYFSLWDEGYRRFIQSHMGRRMFAEDLEGFKPVKPDEVESVCRTKLAHLIKAKPEEIIFLSNTTEGLNLVAHMIEWKEGDEILLNDAEFPSNVYPWVNLEKKGVKIKVIPAEDGALSLEAYAKAISNKTRLIPITYVNWMTGFKHDLGGLSRLARESGSWIVGDVIQALGATPVKAEHFDFMSSGTYKWLLSPVGLSIFYMKESLSQDFDPPILGFDCMSSSEPLFGPFPFKSGLQKFQYATKNLLGIHLLNKALDYMNEIGFENIFARILDLNRELIEGLEALGLRVVTPREDRSRAGIVSFEIERPKEVVHHLAGRKVWVNLRGKYIRVSPNFYNDRKDVHALLNALEDIHPHD